MLQETGVSGRLLAGAAAMMVVMLVGIVGYWWIGGGRWSWHDCVYMTVITVTTVGYGELPEMDVVPYARSLTIVLLLFGTGVLVYFVSTVTASIVDGDFKRALLARRLRKRMKHMKDHMIVCGAGTTGSQIVKELIAVGYAVVAIDRDERVLRELREHNPKANFTYLVGDATDDDLLAQAGIGTARGVVAALSDDKDNLYLVVSARQSNGTARVVARCTDPTHLEKLRRVGADSVVSPNFIGGMRMASEMVRPNVVLFLDEMLRDNRSTMRIEEIEVGKAAGPDGASLDACRVYERFGMTVLAIRDKSADAWIYNPAGETRVCAGSRLIVLGDAEQVRRMAEAFVVGGITA